MIKTRYSGRMLLGVVIIILLLIGSIGLYYSLNSSPTPPKPDSTTNSNTSSEKKVNPEPTTTIDPAAQAYFDAVNSRNLDAAVQAFATDAEVIDVSRSIKGEAAIRNWANNEVIGGTYKIISMTQYDAGQDILIEFTPPGASSGFRASYKFDISNGKIQRANLQYAD
ncbi:MAG TPA: nuclear transport factor 2 family protein [Candidatus Saccharimonadales bacterium]